MRYISVWAMIRQWGGGAGEVYTCVCVSATFMHEYRLPHALNNVSFYLSFLIAQTRRFPPYAFGFSIMFAEENLSSY